MSDDGGGGGGLFGNNNDNNDDDDLLLDDFDMFAASGSLMKDLLADLAVDEDDENLFSLEQLEKELQHLESTTSTNVVSQQMNLNPTAAGMVVSAQQAFATTTTIPTVVNNDSILDDPVALSAVSPMDAWSLSLQKFTASSLEAEFLQADTARKQQQQQQPKTTTTTVAPPPGMGDFQDYDITEKPKFNVVIPPTTTRPPPGLAPDANQQILSQAAAKLSQVLSVSVSTTTTEEAEQQQQQSILSQQQPQQQQKLTQVAEESLLEDDDDAGGDFIPTSNIIPPKPKREPVTPQNSISAIIPPTSVIQQQSSITAPTPQPTPIISKPINPATLMSNVSGMPPPLMLNDPMLQVPVAVPIPTTGPTTGGGRQPAWQTPPPMVPVPQPPRRVVFANPHPSAPPIPASNLSSRYMKPRDISYVVHSMLKPILVAENSGQMSTYHIQYWTRHHPIKPPQQSKEINDTTNKKSSKVQDKLTKEMLARQKKAKEWSEEHKVLGSTSKANVARPRALISVSAASGTTKSNTTSDENKQRAALWKSRIYCDQAYQALTAVIDLWTKSSSTTSTSGGAPAAVQPHLIKLFKCLGASVQTTTTTTTVDVDESERTIGQRQYVIDTDILQYVLKLPKGKVLLARVLEHALLPPSLVQVLLPASLSVLLSSNPTATTTFDNNEINNNNIVDVADDRVFTALTMVIQTLHDISKECIIASIKAVINKLNNSNNDNNNNSTTTVLSSTARMQCIHTLLQRGSTLANIDPEFNIEWSTCEDEFMKILTGGI